MPNIRLFATFIALSALFAACEEKDIDPPEPDAYLLFLKANISGSEIDFRVGDTGIHAWPLVYTDPNQVRRYEFNIIDSNHLNLPLLTLSFMNYSSQASSMASDLDNTFIPGPKDYVPFFPSPANPLGLNEVIVSARYNHPDSVFASNYGFQNTTFLVDSTKNINWHDNKEYKLVYVSFSCQLFLSDSMSTEVKLLQGGKAAVAFPRN